MTKERWKYLGVWPELVVDGVELYHVWAPVFIVPGPATRRIGLDKYKEMVVENE